MEINLSPDSEYPSHELHQGATRRPDELPMVVYLRGDEDFADDFAVGAEQAMDLLGIKRSRLTQISGKELRVGKMRVDRYIRPVYRHCDLMAYLEATRPSVSHKSAAQTMERSVEQVIDRIGEFLDGYSVAQSSHIRTITEDLFSAVQQLKYVVNFRADQFREDLNGINQLVSTKIDRHTERWQKTTAPLWTQLARIEEAAKAHQIGIATGNHQGSLTNLAVREIANMLERQSELAAQSVSTWSDLRREQIDLKESIQALRTEAPPSSPKIQPNRLRRLRVNRYL